MASESSPEMSPNRMLFAEHADAAGTRLDVLAALLESGLSVEIVARGRSMEPIIPDGTRLTLAPIAAHMVRVGDVIALRHGSNIRIHRIVSVWHTPEPVYIARGDSSGTIDPPRHAPDLFGRVVHVRTPTGRSHDVTCASWRRLNRALGYLSRHQLRTIGRWPGDVTHAPRFVDRPQPDPPAPNRMLRLLRGGYRWAVWQTFLSVAWAGVRWFR